VACWSGQLQDQELANCASSDIHYSPEYDLRAGGREAPGLRLGVRAGRLFPDWSAWQATIMWAGTPLSAPAGGTVKGHYAVRYGGL